MTELDAAASAQAALKGIRSALVVGRDIKATANEVNAFLDEEARAKVAWKKRQQQLQRRGDMVFVEAAKEYRVIRQIREAEEQMYKQIEMEFGKKAVQEVKTLIIQMRKDHRELNDVFYRKRMEARKEWGVLIMLSVIIYAVLKFMGAW